MPRGPRRFKQRITVVVAGGLVILVRFSRIALGAHYLTDVLAALLRSGDKTDAPEMEAVTGLRCRVSPRLPSSRWGSCGTSRPNGVR